MPMFKGALSKEGKGVEKGASDNKNAFLLFLELYGRKLWKIMQVGLIYMISSLPTLIVVWFCAGFISKEVVNVATPYISRALNSLGVIVAENREILDMYRTLSDFFVKAFVSLLFMAFWGSGPVTAGYTYILRNYAREEYAWPWSDFWEHTKNNFFQSLVVWIVDVIVFVLLIVAFMFYSTEDGNISMLKYVIAFVFLMYTMMHIYIYQLMVTFKLSIKEIFKNAFLLAIAALPVNALVLVIGLLIHFIFPYCGLNFVALGGSMGFWTIYIFFALFVLQGLSGFMFNFVANRTIKKYVLDKLEAKEIDDDKKIEDLI